MKVKIAALFVCNYKFESARNLLDSLDPEYVSDIFIVNIGLNPSSLKDIIKECNERHMNIHIINRSQTFYYILMNEAINKINKFGKIDYILLLKQTSIVNGIEHITRVCSEGLMTNINGFVLKEIETGHNLVAYNTRLIKNIPGWLYKGRIYERLTNVNKGVLIHTLEGTKCSISEVSEHPTDYIRQIRLCSIDRIESPNDSHIVFVLAQLHEIMTDNGAAYYYYHKYQTMDDGILLYNVFVSNFKCGLLSESLEMDWSVSMGWYMKAYSTLARAEPLILIARHYFKEEPTICHMYATLACQLEKPTADDDIYDTEIYNNERWFLRDNSLVVR